MPPRRGITALVTSAITVLGGCMTAPVAPAPVAAAPAAAAPVVVAAPPAAPCTLGGFLGITPVCAAIGKDIQHKLAFFGQYFPFLEPKPPLLPLTDPANLASSVPAIATAAEIKAAEDMAPQKIKALEYLATIGCGGCYPGVEEAFLAGLDDCTESVRFAAVKAIHKTAGSPCVYCNNKACCSPKLRKRLMEIAFEGSPCPKEPSARVRRMARIALNACGAPPPLVPPPPAEPTEVIPEGPAGPPPAPVPAPPEMIPQAPPPEPYVATPPAPTSVASAMRVMASDPTVSNIVPSFDARADIKADLLAQAEKQSEADTLEDAAVSVIRSDDLGEPGAAVLHDYYAAHRDRYRRPEQVRWESASVRIESCPSPQAASDAMEYLHNRALGLEAHRPAGFRPELVTTHRHDWTSRDEIASPPVAAALFSKSAGAVSDVMTDGKYLILVHVIERRPPGTPPLAEIAEQVRADYLADHREGTIRPVSRETEPEPAPTPNPETAAGTERELPNPFALAPAAAIDNQTASTPEAASKPIASPVNPFDNIDRQDDVDRQAAPVPAESEPPLSNDLESTASGTATAQTPETVLPKTDVEDSAAASAESDSSLDSDETSPRRSRAARIRLELSSPDE